MNSCSVPANYNDIEGIRKFLVWSMSNKGMPSTTIQYVGVLCDKIRELQPNYAAGKKVIGQWKSMDTAPKDGTEILVYGHGSYAVASWDGTEWRDMGDIGWAGSYGDDGNEPTHWMPLPDCPEMEEI